LLLKIPELELLYGVEFALALVTVKDPPEIVGVVTSL
jgi:hypothetical protein